MRRVVRGLYIARDFLDWRFDAFLGGDDIESEFWISKMRGVVGMLVDCGLLDPSDWLMQNMSLSEKCEFLPGLRKRIEEAMWSRVGKVPDLEYQVTFSVIGKVSILGVEMAALTLSRDFMAISVAEFFDGSRRRHRTSRVEKRIEGDKRRFTTPLNWLSPEHHLAEAQSDLELAKAEVIRARDRMRKGDPSTERSDVMKPMPHKARLVDKKAVDRLRKRLASKRDGLFADLEPDAPGRVNASK